LTRIKGAGGVLWQPFPTCRPQGRTGRHAMPAETAIVITAVVVAFGGFAALLAFMDHYASGHRAP